jgi:hypothetical protein
LENFEKLRAKKFMNKPTFFKSQIKTMANKGGEMKTIKLISSAFVIALFFGMAMTAEANLYGPLDAGDFLALNTGAEYGPPPAVGFPDGPTSVGSNEDVSLTYGPSPGQENVDALLFVLSIPDLSELGSGSITFSLDSESTTFGLANFFSTDAAGFPSNIEGIGNGEVGGIKFPDAFHAGVIYDPFSGGPTDNPFGTVNITSPLSWLRVDIFSVEGFDISPNPGELSGGTIVGNTPNSHALAVPEADTAIMLFLSTGLLGLFRFGRKRFFKK